MNGDCHTVRAKREHRRHQRLQLIAVAGALEDDGVQPTRPFRSVRVAIGLAFVLLACSAPDVSNKREFPPTVPPSPPAPSSIVPWAPARPCAS